jgi:hypothetical protein
MISDILFQAVEDIKRYRSDFDCYPTRWPEMDRLLRQMDAMRGQIDSPSPLAFSHSRRGKLLNLFSSVTGLSIKKPGKTVLNL